MPGFQLAVAPACSSGPTTALYGLGRAEEDHDVRCEVRERLPVLVAGALDSRVHDRTGSRGPQGLAVCRSGAERLDRPTAPGAPRVRCHTRRPSRRPQAHLGDAGKACPERGLERGYLDAQRHRLPSRSVGAVLQTRPRSSSDVMRAEVAVGAMSSVPCRTVDLGGDLDDASAAGGPDDRRHLQALCEVFGGAEQRLVSGVANERGEAPSRRHARRECHQPSRCRRVPRERCGGAAPSRPLHRHP